MTRNANAIVQQAVDEQIGKGREIGVQVVAYRGGEKFVDVAAGLADVESGRRADAGTLFNIWSISKAVTATALHIQAERGLVDYDAPIADYWPEFAAEGKGGVTVRHALMHRSGIFQMPEGATPERIADWDWMARNIAALKPRAGPGEKPMYQAMSFGWIIGEIVRRTDAKGRDVNTFVQEEINGPLGIDSLWLGVPAAQQHRIATLVDAMPPTFGRPEDMPPLWAAAVPWEVRLTPEVFQNSLLRSAVIPGVGGIANAGSVARLFAMLANGGELDGVRLLSAERVAKFNEPRTGADEPDEVMFGSVMPLSTSGYWVYAPEPITASLATRTAFGHPGVGGVLAWADPADRLAVALLHNRLSQPATLEEDSLRPVALAVREALAGLKAEA